MPLNAQGCFSVLTLKQTPADLMDKVKKVCEESFAAVISRLNASYQEFCRRTGQPQSVLPWKARAVTFGELYQEACVDGGQAFLDAFEAEKVRVKKDMEAGRAYMIEANFQLVDCIYDYVEDVSPRVVYGLMPPYYPNVSNCYFSPIDSEAQHMSEDGSAFKTAWVFCRTLVWSPMRKSLRRSGVPAWGWIWICIFAEVMVKSESDCLTWGAPDFRAARPAGVPDGSPETAGTAQRR